MEGYFTAKLKNTQNLVRDGYYGPAINSAGMGTERLLKVLYQELREKDNFNKIFLDIEYEKFTEKRKYIFLRDGNAELTFFGWIEFYRLRGLFGMLQNSFFYEFNEFNESSLQFIRENRNECSHDDENFIGHLEDLSELSNQILDLFSKILIETGRIEIPSSTAPSVQLQTVDVQELELLPSEKDTLKLDYDEILRLNPSDIDILFLRAFLMRGEKSAKDDLEKILQLDPNHAEAQKERNWNRNYRKVGNQTPRQPINILQNISINIYFGDVLAALAIVVVILVVLMNHNDTNQSELNLLQTTVEKQSVQFERLENALKEKNTQIEALDADLQQLETMVLEQPPNLAESANEKENDAPQISSLADKNIAEIQYAPQGESIDGTLRAFVFPMLFVGIILFIAWILISRYFFPRLVEWILSRISLKQVLIAFLLWPIHILKESIIGFFSRLNPRRRKKSRSQRFRRK